MARQPRRDRFGTGVLDAYANDAAFVAAMGQPPKRGDKYFNSTSLRYRFYDGTTWKDEGGTSIPSVDLFDTSFVAVPSGPQTVDGVSTSPGDIVILAGYDNGAYTVQAGLWTTNPVFGGSYLPTQPQIAYVISGTAYGNTYVYFDGTTWRTFSIGSGSAVDQTLRWNGSKWVANPDVLTGGNLIRTKDDSVADATQAQDLNVRAGNKTAGTGDGGDFNIFGGTSAGGQKGRVSIDAAATTFVSQSLLPPSPIDGDWVYYNSKFQYWDTTAWRVLYSLPTGTVDKSILSWDVGTQQWTEDPYITASGNTIAGTPDNVADGIVAGATYVYGSTKTAGTGNGGLLGILGGNSFGGNGGSVQILGGTGLLRGRVDLQKLEIHSDSMTLNDTSIKVFDDAVADAAQAASLTLAASAKTAGTGDGGDFFINAGASFGGLTGSMALFARKIRLNAQAATDPAGGLITDVYYNTVETRFKYFDGTTWRALGSGSGLAQAQYIDTASLTLPASAPFAPDGINVVTGDIVLFTALSNPAQNNRFYKATVTGPTITWMIQLLGQNPSGAPTDGDAAYVQKGTVNGDSLWFYDGTVWYDYGASISGTGWSLTGNMGTSPGTNFIGTTDAQAFIIKTNAASRVHVTSGGLVGIGVTPTFDLEVKTGSSNATLRVGDQVFLENVVGNQVALSRNAYYDGQWRYGVSGSPAASIRMHDDFGSGDIIFSTDPAGTAGAIITGYSANANVKMIFKQNGRLGIGNTAPVSTLHVGGRTTISDPTDEVGLVIEAGGGGVGSGVNFDASGAGGARIYQILSTGSGNGGASGPSAMAFVDVTASNAYRYWIDSTGRTFTPGLARFGGNATPAYPVDITNGGTYGMRITGNSAGAGATIDMDASGLTGGRDYAVVSSDNGNGDIGGGKWGIRDTAVSGESSYRFVIEPTGETRARNDLRIGSVSLFAEFRPLVSFTLADNQASPADVFAYTAASYSFIAVEYSAIKNGVGVGGTIRIFYDGTTVSADDTGPAGTGAHGITFGVVVSGGNIRLQYTTTSTGGAGTMKYHVRRW